MVRRWFVMFVLCALLPGAGTVYATGHRIGVSLLTHEHQFYQDLVEGLKEQAGKSADILSITYGEYDHRQQVAKIEELIARKVSALLIAPCDSKAIGEVIVRANQAGIPVFTVDIANGSGKGRVVAHIASDNQEGGRQAGRLMVEALKGKGEVVIINHPNVTSVMERVAGFKEYLDTYHNMQIIADIPAWGQRDRAMAIMEDMLLMMPELDGVFAINDDSALGALRAIEAAGMAGKVVIVGYDATPEGRAAIDGGKIYGDVIQYPREIGRLAMKAVQDYLEGKPVKPYIPVKVGTYAGAGR